MGKFIAEIIRISAPRSGVTKSKQWKLVKITFLVLEGDANFINTEVSLPLWGDTHIDRFLKNLNLQTGNIVDISGDIEEKRWTEGVDEINTSWQFKTYPTIFKLSNYTKSIATYNPVIVSELKKLTVTETDPSIHQICALAGEVKNKMSLWALKNTLKENSNYINALNSDRWHGIFHTLLIKNSLYFSTFIEHSALNLHVSSPNGYTLWDHLIALNDLEKAKLLYSKDSSIAWWNQKEYKRFNTTDLGKLLITEKAILPSDFTSSAEAESISSLEKLVKFFHPKIGPTGCNLVLEKIKKDNLFINLDLLKFIQQANTFNFDINHLQKMIKSFTNFNLINKIFKFSPIFQANDVKIESFLLILTDDPVLKSENRFQMLIKDTEKAIYELEKKQIDISQLLVSDKINTLKKLHDQVSLYLRNFEKAGPNRKLNLEQRFPKLKEINNQVLSESSGFLVKVPDDSHTLCSWGFWMNNCVASYINSCANGQAIVLGIFKDENLIINIEVKNSELKQIYKKANARCSPVERELITKFLHDKGIIKNKKSGSPRRIFDVHNLLDVDDEILGF